MKKTRQKPPKTFTIASPSAGIESFSDLTLQEEDYERCFKIDLSCNLIEDFSGLPELPKLTQLNLDDNPIQSFKGCMVLPKLHWISLKNAPISRSVHLKLMCVIAFGSQVATVNNEKVPNVVRERADALRKKALPLLQQGKVITSLKPLKCVSTREEDELRESQRDERTEKQIVSVATICERICDGGDIRIPPEIVQQTVQELDKLRDMYADSDFGYEEEEEEAAADY